MPDEKEPKKLTFTTEVVGEKILIRCKEKDEVTTGTAPVTIGRFIRRMHGLTPDATSSEE